MLWTVFAIYSIWKSMAWIKFPYNRNISKREGFAGLIWHSWYLRSSAPILNFKCQYLDEMTRIPVDYYEMTILHYAPLTLRCNLLVNTIYRNKIFVTKWAGCVVYFSIMLDGLQYVLINAAFILVCEKVHHQQFCLYQCTSIAIIFTTVWVVKMIAIDVHW